MPVWRPIRGFPRHEVSDTGEIRRLVPGRPPLAIIPCITRDEVAVQLPDETGQPVLLRARWLVAQAFLPPPPLGEMVVVRHRDGDRFNLAAYNLRYVPWRHGIDTE